MEKSLVVAGKVIFRVLMRKTSPFFSQPTLLIQTCSHVLGHALLNLMAAVRAIPRSNHYHLSAVVPEEPGITKCSDDAVDVFPFDSQVVQAPLKLRHVYHASPTAVFLDEFPNSPGCAAH